MEETMAPPGTIESQEAHVAHTTMTSVDGESNGAFDDAIADENAVLHAPVVSETTTNVTETAAASSTTKADAALTMCANEDRDEEMKEHDEVFVNLKFLHRERVTLQCPATILIADLKQRVRDAYNHAVEQERAAGSASEVEPVSQPLRLIYKGKVLKDDQTLTSYSFLNEDTIHAVFSRTSPAVTTQAPASEGALPSASGFASASGFPSASTPTEAALEASDDADNASVTFTRFELPQGADIAQFIASVVNSTLNEMDDGVNTPTVIFPTIPFSRAAAATTSGSASSQASTTTTTASTTTAPAPQAGSATAEATASLPVRSADVPRPSTTAPPPASVSGSSLLLNEAAALRRSIPALELAPLSRPQELSIEMYNLGNAMREAGDTYLAIHRQLQFVATRFLQENHLSRTERERLRSRVQLLVPVIERLSTMSASVALQLSASPYGNAPQNGAPQGQPAQSQAASAPTSAPQESSASEFISSLLQVVGGGQQPTSVNQVVGALPGILSLVAGLAAGSQNAASSASAESAQSMSVGQAAESSQTPSSSFAPISAYPLWSLGYKLQQHLTSRPDYLSLSFTEFVGVVSSLVIDHITRCCASGTDAFVQTGAAEVENAFKKVEQAQGRVYSRVESRCGIVRAALQDLAQICATAVDEVDDVLNVKLRSWVRRSCSHLFLEVSEIMDARRAVQVTAEAIAHVLTGSPTPRTPFHEAAVLCTYQYLADRISFT